MSVNSISKSIAGISVGRGWMSIKKPVVEQTTCVFFEMDSGGSILFSASSIYLT